MKILKYILFFLLVLIGLVFLVGLLKSEVTYGHEIVVDKPIEEAWAVQQDKSKFYLWLEGFKSIDLIEGEEGKIGSKYRVVVNPGEGQPDFEMIETLVSEKENEYSSMSFDSEMMVFEQTTRFANIEGKTSVKTESVIKGKGLVMRSLFALMEMLGGSFQKQETKNIEALKRVINENQTNYFPQVEELSIEEEVD